MTCLNRPGSQIDHLNIAVPDLTAAKTFYEPVLATLDIHPLLDIPATPTNVCGVTHDTNNCGKQHSAIHRCTQTPCQDNVTTTLEFWSVSTAEK